jgi:hypothetical protein
MDWERRTIGWAARWLGTPHLAKIPDGALATSAVFTKNIDRNVLPTILGGGVLAIGKCDSFRRRLNVFAVDGETASLSFTSLGWNPLFLAPQFLGFLRNFQVRIRVMSRLGWNRHPPCSRLLYVDGFRVRASARIRLTITAYLQGRSTVARHRLLQVVRRSQSIGVHRRLWRGDAASGLLLAADGSTHRAR